MATITTEVDVDLSEFETYEILEELRDRMNKSRRKSLKKDEIKELIEIASEILSIDKNPNNGMNSLMDVMKFELFMSGKDSKTLNDFEQFFNK